MSTQELYGRRSALLQRYQPKAGSQDPLQQPMDTTPITKSTSQRSLQNSTLLQKYYQKTTSQDLPNVPSTQPSPGPPGPNKTSSQRSLDQSKLLQRYNKQHSQDSQDIPKAEPQRYSSQKSLESSKLLQRYNPMNNSQEFTGLAARESTPIARFTRSGSLDHDRRVRPSLLSKYTPRFGQSLDRNKAYEMDPYSNYSSQQSLEQQEPSKKLSQSQTIGDYSTDHYDQYDSRNIRSRSSSMARGLAGKSAQRELEALNKRLEMEKENIPLDPVTPETLPVVATSEPIMGNIATALPLPVLSAVHPAPVFEVSQPPPEPVPEPPQPAPVHVLTTPPEVDKPKRKEPVKPPRKDLAPTTTHIFQAEVPLAQAESFTTPLPTPRSRSRTQLSTGIDDDRISRGAESYTFGVEDSIAVKNRIDMSGSNGYAIVRKEPPPRPPAPIRRRKSTRSLGDQRQFSTLPNYHSVSPVRPTRNYSTICPSKPPRGRSISSLNETQIKLSSISGEDIRQYEIIEHIETQAKLHQSLQSGAVVSKMKDRPLPPPPRPPREGRKSRKPEFDEKHDLDGGAERIEVHQFVAPRVVEEVEIAIQTDPVPEDYDLDNEVSETIGAGDMSDRPLKTLQEILKEEQQAELDRARQLAEASNLMRDIQKFRESTSSLSLHGSRPETPAAIAIERRIATPTSTSLRDDILDTIDMGLRPISSENLTEQDLANAEDDKYIAELVKKYVSEEKDPGEAKTKIHDEPVSAIRLRDIESIIVQDVIPKEEAKTVQSEPAIPPRRKSLVSSSQDLHRSVEIPANVIEEIVERLRTNEQQHIAELQQLHQQQLEDLRKEQEEQKRLQEQKLEEQQKQLMEQQNLQLHETHQLKEQITQQQEQQKALLQQQQQQQQQLLLAQQQQQILLQQQEKERELQRERERELLREREIELEKARERERELHHARELELQRARDLELQRAREIEQQRQRELELQRTMELEHQRLREMELQRAQEAEIQRAREAELLRIREVELQRAREAEIQRVRETELQRLKEIELLRLKETEERMKELEERKKHQEPVKEEQPSTSAAADITSKEDTVQPAPTESEIHESIEQLQTAQEPAKEPTPARPPPPRISQQMPLTAQFAYQEYLPYSIPTQPFYPTRNISDDDAALPQTPHRRRRHHRSRRDSTSEEEYQREQRKQRHGTRSPEPSIPALSGQLIRACGSSIRQTGDDFMAILQGSSKDEKKRDLHIALVILIVIVAGLMALGMKSEKAVHHHHWDYFTPPGNSGNT